MSKYRTLLGTLALGLLLISGLLIVAPWKLDARSAEGAFSTYAWAIVGLGGLLAGKSAAEKFAKRGEHDDSNRP